MRKWIIWKHFNKGLVKKMWAVFRIGIKWGNNLELVIEKGYGSLSMKNGRKNTMESQKESYSKKVQTWQTVMV